MMVVQGSFRKEGLGFDAITTGQEFERASALPPSWLVSRVLQKVRPAPYAAAQLARAPGPAEGPACTAAAASVATSDLLPA